MQRRGLVAVHVTALQIRLDLLTQKDDARIRNLAVPVNLIDSLETHSPSSDYYETNKKQ